MGNILEKNLNRRQILTGVGATLGIVTLYQRITAVANASSPTSAELQIVPSLQIIKLPDNQIVLVPQNNFPNGQEARQDNQTTFPEHPNYTQDFTPYPSGFTHPKWATGFVPEGGNLQMIAVTQGGQEGQEVSLVKSVFNTKDRRFSELKITPLDSILPSSNLWRTHAYPDGVVITDGKRVINVPDGSTPSQIYKNKDPKGGIAGTPERVVDGTVILEYSKEGGWKNSIVVVSDDGNNTTTLLEQKQGQIVYGLPQKVGDNVIAAVVVDSNSTDPSPKLLAWEYVEGSWIPKTLEVSSSLPVISVAGNGEEALSVVDHLDFSTRETQKVIYDVKNGQTYTLPVEVLPSSTVRPPVGVHRLEGNKLGVVSVELRNNNGYTRQYLLTVFDPDANSQQTFAISDPIESSEFPPYAENSYIPSGVKLPIVPDDEGLIAPKNTSTTYLPAIS